MNEEFEVLAYAVVEFNRESDIFTQVSDRVGLKQARAWLNHNRECEPTVKFYIISVLDE